MFDIDGNFEMLRFIEKTVKEIECVKSFSTLLIAQQQFSETTKTSVCNLEIIEKFALSMVFLYAKYVSIHVHILQK